jgi:hypothetical protein
MAFGSRAKPLSPDGSLIKIAPDPGTVTTGVKLIRKFTGLSATEGDNVTPGRVVFLGSTVTQELETLEISEDESNFPSLLVELTLLRAAHLPPAAGFLKQHNSTDTRTSKSAHADPGY